MHPPRRSARLASKSNWRKRSTSMPTSKRQVSDLKSVEHLLGYFDPQVLASYRNSPHKYEIESDYFEGTLSITSEYYSELEATGKTRDYVNIRFGYRTLRDGNLAIVAWLPDLTEKSKAHVERLAAFQLKNPDWTPEHDERFSNWVRRDLEGCWGGRWGWRRMLWRGEIGRANV